MPRPGENRDPSIVLDGAEIVKPLPEKHLRAAFGGRIQARSGKCKQIDAHWSQKMGDFALSRLRFHGGLL
jgi:hypothetical protein